MNLDKEFNYVLLMKKFIKNIKKEIKVDNYTNLEYKLKEIDESESITDLDSDSEKIYVNPNMNMNTSSLLNLNLNNIEKPGQIINEDLSNHYKDLLDYTYDKMERLSYILNSV
jgi:hypothetical protein